MSSKLFPLLAGVLGVALVGSATAADDPVRKAQEVRQAPMVLIANNFGYMNAMLKGKVEWNAEEFMARGAELGALGHLDLLRGYIPDSYEGRTRAKPEVELEFDDYSKKMREFEDGLKTVGAAGDAEAMKARVQDLGDMCKSCHKKYKSKNYQGE